MIVELYKKIGSRWKQIPPTYTKEMSVAFTDADGTEYEVILMKEPHEIKPTRPVRDPASNSPPVVDTEDPED